MVRGEVGWRVAGMERGWGGEAEVDSKWAAEGVKIGAKRGGAVGDSRGRPVPSCSPTACWSVGRSAPDTTGSPS